MLSLLLSLLQKTLSPEGRQWNDVRYNDDDSFDIILFLPPGDTFLGNFAAGGVFFFSRSHYKTSN